MRKWWSLVALSLVAPLATTEPASGLSEALARKCLERTLKEYPRPKGYAAYKAGNPGVALARQAYYKDCLAKDGNI